jgi:hypothetical protein
MSGCDGRPENLELLELLILYRSHFSLISLFIIFFYMFFSVVGSLSCIFINWTRDLCTRESIKSIEERFWIEVYMWGPLTGPRFGNSLGVTAIGVSFSPISPNLANPLMTDNTDDDDANTALLHAILVSLNNPDSGTLSL